MDYKVAAMRALLNLSRYPDNPQLAMDKHYAMVDFATDEGISSWEAEDIAREALWGE